MRASASQQGSLARLARVLRASRRRAPRVRIEISFEECDSATMDAYERDIVAAGGSVAWRDADAETGSCLMAVDVHDRHSFELRWSVFPSNELGHVRSPKVIA